MKIIDKYIISNILKGIFTVILLLVLISSLLDFIYQLNDVGKGNYYFFNAIIYSALGIPRLIVQILPAAALIGSLLSLGTLSHNHELIVMRTAGISKKD
jgi:lipopolysaccharide export system permease protein